jgi:phenylacetic acid degradation operon negative regulatory protein
VRLARVAGVLVVTFVSLHFQITAIKSCNVVAMSPLRPLNARSLVLSVLLGLDPPVLPSRALVELAGLFGIAAGTMRTALSRMVAAGELRAEGEGYRLVGRLLERKAAQDIGRRPAPSAWDGAWTVVIVTAERRTITERRAFRSHMANLRMGELRPDTWMRPANLAPPDGEPGMVVTRGPLAGDAAADLVRRLWHLPGLAAGARRLHARIDEMLPALQEHRAEALPAAITLAAEVVRFLRADPLLPPSLTPDPWPADALREEYGTYDRAIGRTLQRFTHHP